MLKSRQQVVSSFIFKKKQKKNMSFTSIDFNNRRGYWKVKAMTFLLKNLFNSFLLDNA